MSTLQYKRIGITVKSKFEAKDESVQKVIDIIEGCGAEVLFDEKRAENIACVAGMGCYTDRKDIDLLICMGGDGTILRAVRELQDVSVPILSINRGTVGFLAEIEFDAIEEVIPEFLHGKGVPEERSVLSVRALRGDTELLSGIALNDAVIAQGTIARLVDLQATVNGEPLTMYHADGLILATPTGSTAYSLAAGGPIVHPSLSAMILTPINPHSFSQKPVVIRGDSVVEVEVCTRERAHEDAEVYITVDGQLSTSLERGDIVEIRVHPQSITFLRRSNETFFGTIREKLKWGERLH